MKTRGSEWSATRKDEAKQMKLDGLSAREAGLRLNATRNAVIGIWHRMGLTDPSNSGGRPKAPSSHKTDAERRRQLRQRDAANKRLAKTSLGPKLSHVSKPVPPVRRDILPPTSATNTTLLKIGHGQCRYIIGNPAGPSTLMCGGPVKDELGSWCSFHCGLLYQPRVPQRRGAPALVPTLTTNGATI